MSLDNKESIKTVSEAAAGASVYSNLLLSVYDVEVLLPALQNTQEFCVNAPVFWI